MRTEAIRLSIFNYAGELTSHAWTSILNRPGLGAQSAAESRAAYMMLRYRARLVLNQVSLALLKLRQPGRDTFECPACGYVGPFLDVNPPTGLRRHAQCPQCNCLERHRVQLAVMDEVLNQRDAHAMRMLHISPEPFLRRRFAARFGQYETADLEMTDVDYRVNLCDLPFEDTTYDCVYASHVLEHIADDTRALSEIRRVLRPNGIAILPVPIVAPATIEYPVANPREFGHVRAPGPDYFEKYERYFAVVRRYYSDAVPARYQPFIYEDRSQYPSEACPLRPAMSGERHSDVVPVCYV